MDFIIKVYDEKSDIAITSIAESIAKKDSDAKINLVNEVHVKLIPSINALISPL